MNELQDRLERVKAAGPLTLSITNQVTINECANGLLAIGASPVMSDDPVDAETLAGLAAATVLNIGTVNDRRLDIMLAAGRAARRAGRPVVLDPVGVGATETRRRAAARILREARPTVIRGNWSEIKALAGLTAEEAAVPGAGEAQKGVDSSAADDLGAVVDTARNLAARLEAVVAVTGAVDVLSDGRTVWLVDGGSPWLARLTGTGCLLSALVGAYVGAGPDQPALSTLAALVHLALAGERAAAGLAAPALGTFRVNLFDHLALITGQDLAGFRGVSQS